METRRPIAITIVSRGPLPNLVFLAEAFFWFFSFCPRKAGFSPLLARYARSSRLAGSLRDRDFYEGSPPSPDLIGTVLIPPAVLTDDVDVDAGERRGSRIRDNAPDLLLGVAIVVPVGVVTGVVYGVRVRTKVAIL